MLNVLTCNSNRMSRSNVNVNNPLSVERGWLDWSVRMSFFHLIYRIWFLSCCNPIQTKLIEPDQNKTTKSKCSYMASQHSTKQLKSVYSRFKFVPGLIFLFLWLYDALVLQTWTELPCQLFPTKQTDQHHSAREIKSEWKHSVTFKNAVSQVVHHNSIYKPLIYHQVMHIV